MKKKNIIFITGGSGRIGKKLTDYLIRNKYKCYINSRKKIKYKKSSDTILYKKDILDKKCYKFLQLSLDLGYFTRHINFEEVVD